METRESTVRCGAALPDGHHDNADGSDVALAKTTANIPLHPLAMRESRETLNCYLTRGTPPEKGVKVNAKIKTGIAYRTDELVNGVIKIGVRCATPVQVSHGAMEVRLLGEQLSECSPTIFD